MQVGQDHLGGDQPRFLIEELALDVVALERRPMGERPLGGDIVHDDAAAGPQRSTSVAKSAGSRTPLSANSRSNGPWPAMKASASPRNTATRGSPASSSRAARASASSISAVTRVQSAGMALAIQAAPRPAPVPSSPIRPPTHPAASTARNRPTPGRQAEARSGPASSLVSGKPSCSATA